MLLENDVELRYFTQKDHNEVHIGMIGKKKIHTYEEMNEKYLNDYINKYKKKQKKIISISLT